MLLGLKLLLLLLKRVIRTPLRCFCRDYGLLCAADAASRPLAVVGQREHCVLSLLLLQSLLPRALLDLLPPPDEIHSLQAFPEQLGFPAARGHLLVRSFACASAPSVCRPFPDVLPLPVLVVVQAPLLELLPPLGRRRRCMAGDATPGWFLIHLEPSDTRKRHLRRSSPKSFGESESSALLLPDGSRERGVVRGVFNYVMSSQYETID